MAKKSKATGPEPLSGDILDLLWTHVINPDPAGAWLDEALKESAAMPEPLKTALPAIHRLLAAKASREDLGRAARQERYERCFGLLYELDNPGLKSGKLTGLREQLLSPPARGGKEKEFMATLWEGIGEADDEGDRWAGSSVKEVKDEPFGDVGAVVTRLLKAGVQPRDLELFARWQRFDATVAALHVFERAGISEAEELLGLHESILSADPSGKEARPGSWPVPRGKPAKAVGSDPLKPFLTIKSIGGFVHSPDGKRLMVAPYVGQFRIVDPETGIVLTNIKTKGKVYCGEFSADGQRVLMATSPSQIEVCDGESGEYLSQVKWPGKAHNIVLLRSPVADKLLVIPQVMNNRGGTTESYFITDGDHLATSEPVLLPCSSSNTNEIEFSPDGRRLIVFHGGLGDYELVAVEWPSLRPIWTANPAPEFGPGSLAVSADGTRIATGSSLGTVVLYNGSSGRIVDSIEVSSGPLRVAFHPGGAFLAIGETDSGRIQIWSLLEKRAVREVDTGSQSCYMVRFSPDGKTLGAVGHGQTMFWRFDPLLIGHT